MHANETGGLEVRREEETEGGWNRNSKRDVNAEAPPTAAGERNYKCTRMHATDNGVKKRKEIGTVNTRQ